MFNHYLISSFYEVNTVIIVFLQIGFLFKAYKSDAKCIIILEQKKRGHFSLSVLVSAKHTHSHGSAVTELAAEYP